MIFIIMSCSERAFWRCIWGTNIFCRN